MKRLGEGRRASACKRWAPLPLSLLGSSSRGASRLKVLACTRPGSMRQPYPHSCCCAFARFLCACTTGAHAPLPCCAHVPQPTAAFTGAQLAGLSCLEPACACLCCCACVTLVVLPAGVPRHLGVHNCCCQGVPRQGAVHTQGWCSSPAATARQRGNGGASTGILMFWTNCAAFDEEVHWLHNLKHPNLVQFYAVCLNPPLVVMEFYKDGSVYALLQKACYELQSASRATTSSTAATPTMAETSLTWDRRLEMLHDVAAGMSYLHGRNHVHGDLRSPNLLMGSDGKVKIGDFGFTKQLDCQTASIQVKRITHPRWIAPELLMASRQSLASDVYSFGMIMYELLTFRIPFADLQKEQVPTVVMRGYRPDLPQQLPPGPSNEDCWQEYIHLMQDCWAQNAGQRPTFKQVVSRLTAMRRTGEAAGRSARSMPNLRAGGSLRPGSASIPSQRAGSAPPGVAAGGSVLQGRAGTYASSLAGSFLQQPAGQAGALTATVAQQPEAATASQRWGVNEQQLFVQLPRHRVSSIPEVESLTGEVVPCSLAALEDADSTAAGPMSGPASLPVSSAVVAAEGEQPLAVAAVALLGAWQQADERDMLVSLASAGLEAERVLLVGSDVPSSSPYGSRQT